MIEIQATHYIERGDLSRWLSDHGLDARDVMEAVIRIDRGRRGRVSAWLDAKWYMRDEDGNRFLDETGENATIGHSSIPLSCWPPLVACQ